MCYRQFRNFLVFIGTRIISFEKGKQILLNEMFHKIFARSLVYQSIRPKKVSGVVTRFLGDNFFFCQRDTCMRGYWNQTKFPCTKYGG